LTVAAGNATFSNLNSGRTMPESKTTGSGDSDFPDPKGMQGWLEREIADITRAAELRIKDASRFVNAYARGEITSEEAAKRGYEYSNRWGDALPGVPRSQGLSDQDILQTIDEARKPGFAERFGQRLTESSKRDKTS
jgi:hypothetical protein